MITPNLFIDINRSWLYFLSQKLETAGIDFIFQTNQLRTNDQGEFELTDDFVIVSPANEWRESTDTPETIEMNFRLGVLTKQDPGDILKAHFQNLAIQFIVQQSLYAPERLLSGYSTGGGNEYALPLRAFNESGDPSSVLDEFGIRYGGGNTWRDQTPEGSDVQFWVLEIPVQVTR